MQLSTIIIDDEAHSIERLTLLLEAHCPEVYLKESFTHPQEGLHAIYTLKPDLVFLDVQMPDMTGFDLLSKIKNFDFQIIFITGYEKYAIQAIRMGALDYLVKPVEIEELKNATQRAFSRSKDLMTKQQVEIVLQRLNSYKVEFAKIALPTLNGYEMIDARSIIYCRAEGSYTIVYFRDGEERLISQPLGYMESLLAEFNFLRVHRSFVVNMSEVISYTKGDGGFLEVKGLAEAIPVSRQSKETLLEFFRPKM
jgi:two-component system, LytTR family, response regulator